MNISVAIAFTVLWLMGILDFISTTRIPEDQKIAGYILLGIRLFSLSVITLYFTHYRI